jgi:hypothetical protein
MYLLGYSLNNLSLMALTLSVGFVVDDAIVMLENIVRHMEMGESRMEAALAGVARDRLHHRLDDHLAGQPSSSRCCSWAASWAACCTSFPSPSRWRFWSRASSRSPDAHAGQPLPEELNAAGALVRAHAGDRLRFQFTWPCGADAGGHGLPVQDHAHRLHSQPGQRLCFSASPWGRRTSHSNPWRGTSAPSPRSSGRSGIFRRGIFVMGGNQAFFFAQMKPRAQRALSVDQSSSNCARS